MASSSSSAGRWKKRTVCSHTSCIKHASMVSTASSQIFGRRNVKDLRALPSDRLESSNGLTTPPIEMDRSAPLRLIGKVRTSLFSRFSRAEPIVQELTGGKSDSVMARVGERDRDAIVDDIVRWIIDGCFCFSLSGENFSGRVNALRITRALLII